MLKAAEQANLTELMTPAGTLDRRLGPDQWFVPGEISLQEDRLWWWYYDSNNKIGRLARPRDGMLEAFLALAGAPGEKILRYAKRWGVLMICDHMLPLSHNPNHLEIDQQLGCRPLGWRSPPYWEPLEAWRHYAGQAHALLRIANRVHQGKSADPADWELVYAASRHDAPNTQGSVWADRHMLTLCLDQWLHWANVRANITWPDQQQRPTIRFGSSGLFSALAVQLVLAIARVDGMAVCCHCNCEYIPAHRRPKAGQRNFCPSCRKAGVSRKYSLRDFRERSRKAR